MANTILLKYLRLQAMSLFKKEFHPQNIFFASETIIPLPAAISEREP